jgi:hypothetical protein
LSPKEYNTIHIPIDAEYRIEKLVAGPRHVLVVLISQDKTYTFGWGASRHGQLGEANIFTSSRLRRAYRRRCCRFSSHRAITPGPSLDPVGIQQEASVGGSIVPQRCILTGLHMEWHLCPLQRRFARDRS